MRNLVSILIPCYNSEQWIKPAIESALAQTWTYKEVIVVDDGSSDRSLDIIQSFGDQIRWETGPNRGANTARNRLLELSRGDWLQYLDADDYLLPTKVAGQMEFIEDHPSTDLVYGPVMIERGFGKSAHRELIHIPEPLDPWVLLARWYLPQTGASLWRRETVRDVGGWKVDQPCCQEHELYLRLLIEGKTFAYSESSGAIYRQWGDQTLCTQDVSEVHLRRLEIEQRIEDYLRGRGELTRARLHAINLARFEIARSEWPFNGSLACEIVSHIYETEPHFVPDDTPAAPHRYRAALQLFGFDATERLAKWLRRGAGVRLGC